MQNLTMDMPETGQKAKADPKAAANTDASAINAADFPLREARRLVKDLWQPNPRIYWTDFLISCTLGWAAIVTATLAPFLSLLQIAAMIVATLAMYRAVIFIHELAHFRKNTFGLFRAVWNATCGMPMLVPSYSYTDVHIDHHKPQVYGTKEDGEYLPFAVDKPWKILAFLAGTAITPALLLVRSTVIFLIACIVPPVRTFMWRHLSSLVIDFTYDRPAPRPGQGKSWFLQDLGAAAYAFLGLGLIYAGIVPVAFLGVWYVMTFLVLLLNGLRTLAAHAYRNPGDRRMTQQEEFLDSVDVPGNRYITPLWAPVGLRFHATHHLFPGMPYHQLEKAHERLKAELPDNRLYLAASRKNLWVALTRLWHEAKAAQAKG
ncbi:fatty acid desaturase family protein [Kordiimonas marina]|uniref:fatty acid desaturase family protein n=1 Tax=Kordiimonas marina TaxID=2872312 RepID=UPI001FF26FFE|nr:fatty acid desaturase [Kordiimonas marina]MCJ9428632.1 fatty acid desaturase [Kordiimonas marina]